MTKYSSEEIYNILEEELVTLQIKPNEILSENTLCTRFDVSRTIVRSALQRLSQTGFVEIIPHVGTRVTPIDLEEVNQFIYMRIAVESRVLRDFIATMTPPQVERLRFCKNALEEAVKNAGDLSKLSAEQSNTLLTLDLAFHQVYFECMGKSILWDILTQPKPGYSRFIRLDMLGGKNLPDVISEHAELMDIIDHAKTGAIENVVSRHLYGGIRRLGSKIYSDQFESYIKY